MKDNKKGVNLRILLVGIGIIILLVLGLSFYLIKPRPEAAKSAPEVVEKEFGIYNLVFASFIDEDFNYVEKEDATFILGDSAYLYFEVSGFEQKKGNLNLVQDLEVIGPNGEIVLDEEEIAVVNYDNLKETFSYVPLKNIIRIPQSYEEGSYKVKVTVTDKLTGKKITKEASFRLIDKFNVGSIMFASFIDEDYNYDIKETPVYNIGEPIYLYFEVSGYATISEVGGRKVRLIENIITKNKAGTVVEELNVKNHIADGIPDPDVAYIRYQEKFETKGLEPGSYSMEIIVFDDISKQRITKTVKFDLVQ